MFEGCTWRGKDASGKLNQLGSITVKMWFATSGLRLAVSPPWVRCWACHMFRCTRKGVDCPEGPTLCILVGGKGGWKAAVLFANSFTLFAVPLIGNGAGRGKACPCVWVRASYFFSFFPEELKHILFLCLPVSASALRFKHISESS